MNTLRGTGQLEMGGALRPFHVGTNQTAIFCELQKIDLQDYNDLLVSIVRNQALKARAQEAGEPFTPEGRKEMTPSEHRDFLYSALAAGAQNERLAVDFTSNDVGNWLDEADQKEATKPVLMQIQLMADRLQRGQPGGNVVAQPEKPKRASKPKAKSRK